MALAQQSGTEIEGRDYSCVAVAANSGGKILGKRGFIRYARSSAKRDEFGSNISAAWLVPSKGICCQNRPFCAEPEGKSHFSFSKGNLSVIRKKCAFALIE